MRAIVAGPDITDLAGVPADRRQHERITERYRWAASFVAGKDVCEIACGSGQGLGLLRRTARLVVGGDYSMENLGIPRRTYGAGMPLLRMDAQHLPFGDACFDVLIVLEALYFFPSDREFFAESRRVLRPGGKLLISVINRDTADYNPRSIYHNHYGARELARLCGDAGFDVELFGTVPLQFSARERLLRPVKRLASRLGVVPTAKWARVLLKRAFFGALNPLPFEIAPGTPRSITRIASDAADAVHQVVLGVATRR